jgi:hypothetical protein
MAKSCLSSQGIPCKELRAYQKKKKKLCGTAAKNYLHKTKENRKFSQGDILLLCELKSIFHTLWSRYERERERKKKEHKVASGSGNKAMYNTYLSLYYIWTSKCTANIKNMWIL